MNPSLTLRQTGSITIIGKAGTLSAQLARIAAMHSAVMPRDQDIDASAPNYNPQASQVHS